MDNESHETPRQNQVWKPAQTYTMAVVCLIVGLAIGYLLRGSASQPAVTAATESPAATQPAQPDQDPHAAMGQRRMPSLDEMKQMADKQTEPLLVKLKKDPKNPDLLNQIGTMYRATHQFKTAIDYYQRSLAINPKNVGARTDLASCLYYTGDIDGAIAQLNKSLTYDPKFPGTLMNLGIIKWKGKNDTEGALAAWETLLKLNPDFPQKDVIQHLIDQVKQQQSAGNSSDQPKG